MLFGVGAHEFLKTGIVSVLFILFFKWAAPKTRVPALTTTAAAI